MLFMHFGYTIWLYFFTYNFFLIIIIINKYFCIFQGTKTFFTNIMNYKVYGELHHMTYYKIH